MEPYKIFINPIYHYKSLQKPYKSYKSPMTHPRTCHVRCHLETVDVQDDLAKAISKARLAVLRAGVKLKLCQECWVKNSSSMDNMVIDSMAIWQYGLTYY